MNLEEKTIETTSVFQGRFLHVVDETVELPNGDISHREIVRHPGAVAILPMLDDERFLMVKQYRKPLEKAIWEIPAGKLDAGETPYQAAVREMEEEIQYRGDLTEMMTIATTPGFTDETMTIFIGEHLEKVAHPRPKDDDEFLEVGIFTLETVPDLIDSKTILALQQLQLKRWKNG